jgi:putative FmdB family regulatory protein
VLTLDSWSRRVPTYGYDCVTCGAFDLVRPMSQVDAPAPCPSCDEPGRRLFGAPSLRSLDPALTRAVDASARTAEAPGVVDRLPSSRRRTRYTTDPRHLRLPRP